MNRRTVIGATVGAGVASIAGCVFADDEVESRRGELEVIVNGSELDLSAERYQAEHADNHSVAFHLHERDDYWYMEGESSVTFAEGIDLLPHFEYENRDGEHVVTIDGTTYDARESETEITFLIEGDQVDPTTTEPANGDALRLEITTDAG